MAAMQIIWYENLCDLHIETVAWGNCISQSCVNFLLESDTFDVSPSECMLHPQRCIVRQNGFTCARYFVPLDTLNSSELGQGMQGQDF